MEISKIPQADILDIIFDGRNKEYGAYDLRKTYNRRLKKSLAVTGSVCFLLIGSYVLAGKLDKSHVSYVPKATEFFLEEVKTEKPIEPPPPIKLPPPPHVATIQFTIPKIVPADQVKPDEVPPKNDDLDNAKIATVNSAGDVDGGIVTGPPSDHGADVITPPVQKDDDATIFVKVEVESSYPGGTEAWRRFLLKNLHPDKAIEAGISGTVIVQFIVDKEGNVSNVEAISGPEEIRQEAVRVIKRSGKWTPAEQNGRHVNSYKKQPITVQIGDE